ncbi:MAG: ABC transporter permease [Bacteroidia bacterium]|nr:ABC transporter permease [Bacteroidia bacterium]
MNYLVKELKRHRWRTAAGISGYAIASLFILLVLSVTMTNEQDSVGILKGTGTDFIVYIPSSSSCCSPGEKHDIDGSLIAEGGYTMMLNSDLIFTLKEMNGVKDAAPYILYKIFDKNLNSSISLGGIDTSSIATKTNVCASSNLISGRYFSENPVEVVAEESFAMAHKLSAGDTLHTYGTSLIVGGIVNSGIKPGKADLYGPINNVRKILKEELNCISEGFDMNIVLVEVADARNQNQVIKQVRERMNYLSVSSYNCYQPATEVMGIMEGTSALITFLVFFFLLIFSAKTQLTNLIERYREIGILKSLGWSDSKLSLQILAGSALQSVTGSIIGITLGIASVILLNLNDIRLFNSLEFNIQYDRILLLILLSLSGGIIASIFPVIKLHRTKAGDMINNFN